MALVVFNHTVLLNVHGEGLRWTLTFRWGSFHMYFCNLLIIVMSLPKLHPERG